MYSYFIENGFQGERNTRELYAWLRKKGFTFEDYNREGEAHCRYIFINGIRSGECWCNFEEELDYYTLIYIADNDLMSLCDANM